VPILRQIALAKSEGRKLRGKPVVILADKDKVCVCTCSIVTIQLHMLRYVYMYTMCICTLVSSYMQHYVYKIAATLQPLLRLCV
jgi:hypothetical protein